jgi:hypothetical protein
MLYSTPDYQYINILSVMLEWLSQKIELFAATIHVKHQYLHNPTIEFAVISDYGKYKE